MLETNTRGPFLAAQAAYPHLKAAHGRIVNIGSRGGIRPWPTATTAPPKPRSTCSHKLCPGLDFTPGDGNSEPRDGPN